MLQYFSDSEHYKKTPVASGVPALLKSRIGSIRYKENVSEYIIAEDQDFSIELIKNDVLSGYTNEILYEYRLGYNLQGRN